MAVFAHPDDEELACFGTLARLSRLGFRVCVFELSRGERTSSPNLDKRLSDSNAAASLGGYELITESLPDGKIRYDIDTITTIERHIQYLSPSVVITHYPQDLGRGHQDHLVIANATVNAARRNSCVDWILYAEPPTQNWDFYPNIFVDITEFLPLKRRAIELHESELSKPYMHSSIVATRAHWWAIQAHTDAYLAGRSFEAFVVVKGVIGANAVFCTTS